MLPGVVPAEPMQLTTRKILHKTIIKDLNPSRHEEEIRNLAMVKRSFKLDWDD